MTAYGIVRRIDDLGRVVIPKEIRKKMGLEDGTPVEMFMQNGNELVLKKYDFSEKGD